MQQRIVHIIFFAACLIVNESYCQSSKLPVDSALLSNSEKWKVKANRKMFGGGAPSFGPYATVNVEKLDSPVIRSKIKGERDFSVELSRSESNLSQTRNITYQVKKHYRLQVAKEADTSEALFTRFTEREEKRKTFLGEMISKKDDDDEKVINSAVELTGFVIAGSTQYEFYFHHYTSGNNNPGNTVENGQKPNVEGYIKIAGDSILVKPILSVPPKSAPAKFRDMFIFTVGFHLVNSKGQVMAALEYPSSNNNVWIRKDIDSSLQLAIATYLAIIISA